MKGNRYILLLEDDAVESMRVERVLKSIDEKLQLNICQNGQEGLAWLNNNANNLPAIILLDLNMPIMNGIELLRLLKVDEIWKMIPVIVLTTSSSDSDKQATYSLGISGYMVKPVRYNDFTEVMTTLFKYWDIAELAH